MIRIGFPDGAQDQSTSVSNCEVYNRPRRTEGGNTGPFVGTDDEGRRTDLELSYAGDAGCGLTASPTDVSATSPDAVWQSDVALLQPGAGGPCDAPPGCGSDARGTKTCMNLSFRPEPAQS